MQDALTFQAVWSPKRASSFRLAPALLLRVSTTTAAGALGPKAQKHTHTRTPLAPAVTQIQREIQIRSSSKKNKPPCQVIDIKQICAL